MLSKSPLRFIRLWRIFPPPADFESTSNHSFESDSGRWRGPVFRSSRHLYLIILKEYYFFAGLKLLLKLAGEGEDPCRKLKPIVLLPNVLKKPEPVSLFSENHTAVIFWPRKPPNGNVRWGNQISLPNPTVEKFGCCCPTDSFTEVRCRMTEDRCFRIRNWECGMRNVRPKLREEITQNHRNDLNHLTNITI